MSLIRIVKVENPGIEHQLGRIADLLEELLRVSNPLPPDLEVPDTPESRVFYTDENIEIVRERLAAMGKEYKSTRRE